MPRKIQTTFTKYPKDICCLGDSNTYNINYPNTRPEQYFPGVLSTLLTALSATYTANVRNWGISGNTSGQSLVRVACVIAKGVPTIASVYVGVNDSQYDTTVASASSSTVFTVQAGLGANYKAGSYVLVNGVSRLIASVSTDTITLASALGGTPSNGQAVKIDTAANLLAIGAYLKAAGCTRVLVIGQQYLNWATSGDTTSAQNGTYQTLRGVQSAAATAITALGGITAVYVDLYAYFRALILAGTISAGVDTSIHVATTNGHYNAVGQAYIGAAVFAAIQAQNGWLGALAA